MGIIWEAEDTSLQRVVALKMIRGFAFSSDSERQRFRAEANAVAQLDHPNIVPVYEVGEIDDQPYFSMKLLQGGTLSQSLQDGALEARDAAAIMEKLARAIHHAHGRGVLHRDLKPDNVLLGESGEPYLTDFGLAKLLDSSSALTLTHAHIGTPQYMSPEQARGRACDITATSDVWAAGALLFHTLTGRLPFPGSSSGEIFDRVAHAEPASMQSEARPVDKELETLCLRCLEKEPARRLCSAEELADELGRWLKGEAIHSRPATRIERARRHPWHVALSAAVLLVAAGTAASLFLASGGRFGAPAPQSADEQPLKAGDSFAQPLIPPTPIYKAGDSHPDGGIVASVDESKMNGLVVDTVDSEPLNFEDARAAARTRGGGWRLPSMEDLKIVQKNLGSNMALNFKTDAFYLTGNISSAAYRSGINLTTGKETGGLYHKNPYLVRFVRNFRLPTRYQILAHQGYRPPGHPDTLKVGDTHPRGGIVAWVDFSGKRGLVIDAVDSGRFNLQEAIATAEARGAGWELPSLEDLKIVQQNLGSLSRLNFNKDAPYLTGDESSRAYLKGLNLTTGQEDTGLFGRERHPVRFVRTFDPDSLQGLKQYLAFEESERHPRAKNGVYSVHLVPKWKLRKGYTALEVIEVKLGEKYTALRVNNYRAPEGYQPSGQIIPWLTVDDNQEVMILPRPPTLEDPGVQSHLEKQKHPDYGHVTLRPRADEGSESYLFHEGGELTIKALSDRNSTQFSAWKLVPVQ